MCIPDFLSIFEIYSRKYLPFVVTFLCKTQWSEVNIANPNTSDNFVYKGGDNCCMAIVVSDAVSYYFCVSGIESTRIWRITYLVLFCKVLGFLKIFILCFFVS